MGAPRRCRDCGIRLTGWKQCVYRYCTPCAGWRSAAAGCYPPHQPPYAPGSRRDQTEGQP